MKLFILLVMFGFPAAWSTSEPEPYYLAGAKARFDPRNRHHMRGITGRRVELPCTVRGDQHFDIYWAKKGQVIHQDQRISFHWEPSSNTFMMTINTAREDDAGAYRCIVLTPHGELSKPFHLEMFAEDDPHVDWRWDSRCGRRHPLLGYSGHHPVPDARCDGLGTYPCCSDYGWCGFSEQHCDCQGCIDYSREPIH